MMMRNMKLNYRPHFTNAYPILLGFLTLAAVPDSHAAIDPGVRQGPLGVGQAMIGIDATQQSFFTAGQQVFQAPQMIGDGLGPRFNLDSCGGCHAYPAVGGSAPSTNPQFSVATAYGAQNRFPSFLSLNGPIRQARFVSKSNGTPDGTVHPLFVISGRSDGVDASGCNAVQEDFDAEYSKKNIALRIPIPLFGDGLIEQITDTDLMENLADDQILKTSLGISGRLNYSPTTGNVTRFGWKAQSPSILLFTSEALNAEMGITNKSFPVETEDTQTCQFAPLPNNQANIYNTTAVSVLDYAEQNSLFIQLLSQPSPSGSTTGGTASIARGEAAFDQIGCSSCHTPALSTSPNSAIAPLSSQTVLLFSDLALHNMGPGLADGILQGVAKGDEFRTAPLWGLGQRIFFLHDGRTTDLVQAILAHASNGNRTYGASEANKVISKFNKLSDSMKQDLLNFLRSL